MNEQWEAILESKQRERSRLASLSFTEKVAILEKLRDRALAIADSPLYRAHESADSRTRILREARKTERSGS